MLSQTCLDFDTTQAQLLVDKVIDFMNWRTSGERMVDFEALDLPLAGKSFPYQQDSVLKEVVKWIRKENLLVDKT